jgi:streptogramin lyase
VFWAILVILASSVTASVAVGDISEYPVPTSGSHPSGVAVGADGNLWFTEHDGNSVAKVTTSGVITEYPVPTVSSGPSGIAAGPDGTLWFTESMANKVASVTPSGLFTEYAVPTVGSGPSGIAMGPDGNLWFTEYNANQVAKMTTLGVFTEYSIPTANSQPLNIAVGPDGNLWFTEFNARNVAKMTTSGAITEYTSPIFPANCEPNGIALGPDGNLWFTLVGTNQVAKVTTSGIFTAYSVPTVNSAPFGITAGPAGDLWLTEYNKAQVARMTISGVFTEYSVPTASSAPYGIATGPDGNIWLTEYFGNKIARVLWPAPPDAPTNTSATPGDASATVSWTAAVSNGSAITGYTVTSSPGGITASAAGSLTSTTVGGLTNGTAYTFTTTATNGLGAGPASAPSISVIVGAPSAPTYVIATPGNASATVSWTAPSSNGSSITGYTVTSSPGGFTVSAAGSAVTATVGGLTNGTAYSFTVTASNGAGTGLPSASSNRVTVGAPTAPTSVTAAIAQGGAYESAVVSWTAASPNGNPIALYTVTSSSSGTVVVASGNATSATVPYVIASVDTFTVTATNVVGTGPASVPSNTVMFGPPGQPTNVLAVAGNASARVSWTPPISTNGAYVFGYTVTASPGGFTSQTGSFSALTNGITYTFTVAATNQFGTGPPSTPSNSVTPIGPPDAPTGVSASAGDAAATVNWTTPNSNGSAITGYTVISSPGGVTASASGNAGSATVGGLTNGTTYSFTVAATNYVGTGASSAASNSVTPSAAFPAVSVLPAMSNGAYGGYVTAATIQNTGSGPASVRIDYFDQNGAPVGAGDTISNLAVNASWTVRQDNGNSFPSSGGDAATAGSAVVYSDQPVAAFVNEFAPGNVGDATSYSGVQVASGVGATLYAPTIVNNAYGGYTTGIGLLNEGASTTDVTITYRDASGALITTQTVPGLAAHAYHALYSGDTTLALPSGFAGTATITNSAAQPLGAIVNETGPGGQFSSYDAVPSGSTTLYAPAALRNAFGGFNTGMGIVNTTGTTGTVTITYFDASGTPTINSFNIPADGYLGVYQGTDIPTDGAYTAKITSSVAIAAIVNEVAASTTSAMQSTSYNTFSAGNATLNLALVENAGSDPWNTGDGIMNTGIGSTTVTVNYFNTVTGASVGTTQTQLLAPNAFWGLYQPTGGLPTGQRATAVITTSSGGQVAVICNESSTTTFMSYDGQ